MSEENSWEELIDRHLHGELDEAEKERLAELLDSDAAAQKLFVEHVQWDTEVSEALREQTHALSGEGADLTLPVKDQSSHTEQSRIGILRLMLTAAAVVIVALSSGLIYQIFPPEGPGVESNNIAGQNQTSPPAVATITGLSGSFVWTGDRGQMVRDIAVGTDLAGGTIEGTAPDSWFELKFNDGSKVVIAGISQLTFSDDGQKILRLREGQLTADVNPQPPGRAMLVNTRTAAIEVVGTQFDLQSAMASTVLNVSEGSVRLRRLSDGREVSVQAEHVVIADDESSLVPERVPTSVHHWESDFNNQSAYYGRWKPASNDRPASVRAIPLIPPGAPNVTLHLAGLPVRTADGSRVVVQTGSRFIVRGLLQSQTPVYFGIRVNHPNGDFAGMFRGDLQREQTKAVTDSAGRFEEIFELNQFTVDPAVWHWRHELAARPDELVLDGVWVFTHSDPPSGLEVINVQLVPAEE